ncbi:MAG: hypothetical protein OHK0023_06520 [Anaerolineae bacterium]
MQCPECGSENLKVLDTTDTKTGIRRRRECLACGARFTTHERLVTNTPVLIKANGMREAFDRDKLRRGIWYACAKRPISAATIEQLVTDVERYLQHLNVPEVASSVVGDRVIVGLKALDPIAYIRYAIVYLKLDNLLSVRAEIDKLLATEQESASKKKSRKYTRALPKTDANTSDLTDQPIVFSVAAPPTARAVLHPKTQRSTQRVKPQAVPPKGRQAEKRRASNKHNN